MFLLFCLFVVKTSLKTSQAVPPQMSDQKKKKKRKKRGIPDRWLDYCPVGRRIPGTRFIAFKVPLKASLNSGLPESDMFGLWDLLDSVRSQNQDLGLIIDLTFTSRYYVLTDVPQSCSYVKIPTEGHRVPSDATVLSFKRAVRWFLRENRDNDQLIGVHCTHGLNRTGYLVCRYLIDVDGLDAAVALQLFNSCRGHHIERQNYLDDLQRGAKRSNAGIDETEEKEEAVRGLAVERPPLAAKEQRQDDPAAENQPAGNHRHHCQARHKRAQMAPPCSSFTPLHHLGPPPSI